MAAVADGYVQTEALPPVLVLHATEAAPSTLQFRPTGSNGSHVGHDNSINGGGTAANSDAEQSSDPEPDKEQDYENGMDVNDENATPDDDAQASGGDRKPRRELPPATVKILKDWMLSTEHIKHPYPTDDDKKKLLETTGINMKQLTNWFTNARKRIWKPMMRREHSRQLQTSLDIEASSGTAALPVATDSTASYSYPIPLFILKDWMLSPEHVEHPYPTDLEKKQLCDETGLDLCQLNNWFANNRKRLWKPTMANRSKALYTNE
ncbi:hypothetical protein DYB38_011710, partial [Aphanomyces astaci]